MKILIFNGSPRKQGNTAAAVKALCDNAASHTTEVFTVVEHNILPCVNCDSCKKNNGKCAHPDETNLMLDKIMSAGAVIFATPVYWWGITAQLKTAIDKMYARADELKSAPSCKKIGLIIIGADEVSNAQYRIITEQFECICKHLNWELVFSHPVSAFEAGELANNPAELDRISSLIQKL